MARGLMRHVILSLVCATLFAAFAAQGQALRDPTRPPGASARSAGKVEPSGWNLQSILISPERRYAIINGEVVAIGGTVSGAELVAVAPERVTLKTHEGLRIVQLYPDVIRPGADAAATNKRAAADTGKDQKIRKSGSKN